MFRIFDFSGTHSPGGERFWDEAVSVKRNYIALSFYLTPPYQDLLTIRSLVGGFVGEAVDGRAGG